MPDLNPCAVSLKSFFESAFHRPLIFVDGHVDQVDNHKSAQITDSQLAGDFLDRFEVGMQGGFFNIATFSRPRRVDVDGYQRLSMIDCQGATRRQADFTVERRINLSLDCLLYTSPSPRDA